MKPGIAVVAVLVAAVAFIPPSSTAQPAPEVLTPSQAAQQWPSFESYWYQGLAELSRYRLEQSRYGEIHEGEAVLIYVTEDFHPELQVKLDSSAGRPHVPILKLISYRRFYTGIYPYNVLTSVFTSVGEGAETLKISHGTQEWCGQAYSQLNRREDGFHVTSHSYFEREADLATTIPLALTEDELWTRIRLDPSSLPQGDQTVLPATHYLRLMHRPFEALSATLTLDAVSETPYSPEPAQRFTIAYAGGVRTVRIFFESAFPNRILAWEEEQPALFNPSGGEPERLTTRAVLTDGMLLDYWSRHGVGDAAFRQALGLTH